MVKEEKAGSFMELEDKENGKVLYKRTNKRGMTIFIKETKGSRKYPQWISKDDKLILIGIRNERTKQELSFPYSWLDQIEQWKKVFEIQILPSQRQKIIKKLENLLREFKENGESTKNKQLNLFNSPSQGAG